LERPSTTHRPVVDIEIKDSDDSSLEEQASGQETGNNKEALQAKSDDGNVRVTTTSPAAVSGLQLDSVNSVEKPQNESVEDQQTKETREANSKNLNTSRLSFKIALSPDYSSVRYSSFTKSGINYGILADYHITPRWSVSVGALSSRKIYSASNVEYNGYTADKADGDCRIIDIPVNVYYYFETQSAISFYAGIGISSYIMNSEKYEFHGKNYTGSYSYTHKVEGKNNEMLSVINVSAGVQKQLTDRWAIQLEPFVKQSIKGIGEGDLSLSSLGAFLNLRYTIIKVNNP
jgi:outer membrane protein W